MEYIHSPFPVLGFRFLHIPPPDPILGVGLLCKSDDPTTGGHSHDYVFPYVLYL